MPTFDLPLPEDYLWDGPGIQGFPQPGLNGLTFQSRCMCLHYKRLHSYTIFHFPDIFDSVHFGLRERRSLPQTLLETIIQNTF